MIVNPTIELVPVLRPLLKMPRPGDSDPDLEASVWDSLCHQLPGELQRFVPGKVLFSTRREFALELLAKIACTPSGARQVTRLWGIEPGLFAATEVRLQTQPLTTASAEVLAHFALPLLLDRSTKRTAADLLATLLPYRPELFAKVRQAFEKQPVPASVAHQFFQISSQHPTCSPELAASACWLFANQPAVHSQPEAWNLLASIYPNGWDELLSRHGHHLRDGSATCLLNSYTRSLGTKRDPIQVTNAFRIARAILEDETGRRDAPGAADRVISALTLLGNLRGIAGQAANQITPLLLDRRREVASAAAAALLTLGPTAPESIPDLLPALRRSPTAARLVCLLARYGKNGTNAVATLTVLASGTPLEVVGDFDHPSGLRIDPILAARYGLKISCDPRDFRDHRPHPSCGPTTSTDLEVNATQGISWGFWPRVEPPSGSVHAHRNSPNTISLAALAGAAVRQIAAPPDQPTYLAP